MRVLLTGATGFIGGHVYKYLSSNCEINVICSSKTISKKEPVMSSLFVPHDIYEEPTSELLEKFGNPDAVIHLAWDKLNDYNSRMHEELIYPAHLKFLKNLLDGGLKNLTIIGTCQEYGMQEGCLAENIEAMPATAYARAKHKLYTELLGLIKNTDVSLKWVRVFYVYGDGQSENSLVGQLYKALENSDTVFNMSAGDQIRDFIHVDLLSRYIAEIALQDNVQGVINCCSGVPITVKEFVETRIAERDCSIKLNLGYYPYPPYEPKSFWGETSKLNLVIESNKAKYNYE